MVEPNLDEIFQKKLLLKYDKGLTKFSSEYIALLSNKDFEEVREKAARDLLDELDNLEYQSFKYSTALQSIDKDNLIDQVSLESMHRSVESAKQEIERLKKTLIQQEQIRINKQQYNQLAKQVISFGKKSEVLKQIQEVRVQMQITNKANEEELRKISKQEGYLRTLISSLACLLESNGTY